VYGWPGHTLRWHIFDDVNVNGYSLDVVGFLQLCM